MSLSGWPLLIRRHDTRSLGGKAAPRSVQAGVLWLLSREMPSAATGAQVA